MPKNYNWIIIIHAIQLLMLAMLINNIVMERFGFFQSERMGLLEIGLGAVIFALSIVSIFSMRSIYINGLRMQRLKLDSLKYKHIEEQNRVYKQHRHDLNNHLTVISGLAQLGGNQELKEYVSSYVASFNKSIITVNTGIKELDVLYYAKISEAMDKDIAVDYDLSVAVSRSPKRVIALVGVLSNTLDNAIEASLRGPAPRKIKLSIAKDPLDYIFIVSNTYDTSSKLNFWSKGGVSSKGQKGHGEGVRIIRKTVQSLQGALEYRVVEDLVELRIEIPRMVLEGKV